MSLSMVAPEQPPKQARFRTTVVIPLRRPRLRLSPAGSPVVDIVIPVHNGERDLARGVERLHAFLQNELPFSARITIADRASTDATRAIAAWLGTGLASIRVLRLSETGRGRALAAAWLTSDARIVASLEAGPSADLAGLLPLLAPVISGHSEISVRRVQSPDPARLRALLGLPTGEPRLETAMRTEVARRLVPYVIDRSGRFDTELVLRARRAGLRIHEPATQPTTAGPQSS